jgi:hypothetical protein
VLFAALNPGTPPSIVMAPSGIVAIYLAVC